MLALGLLRNGSAVKFLPKNAFKKSVVIGSGLGLTYGILKGGWFKRGGS